MREGPNPIIFVNSPSHGDISRLVSFSEGSRVVCPRLQGVQEADSTLGVGEDGALIIRQLSASSRCSLRGRRAAPRDAEVGGAAKGGVGRQGATSFIPFQTYIIPLKPPTPLSAKTGRFLFGGSDDDPADAVFTRYRRTREGDGQGPAGPHPGLQGRGKPFRKEPLRLAEFRHRGLPGRPDRQCDLGFPIPGGGRARPPGIARRCGGPCRS